MSVCACKFTPVSSDNNNSDTVNSLATDKQPDEASQKSAQKKKRHAKLIMSAD